jgi:hypothetical protein
VKADQCSGAEELGVIGVSYQCQGDSTRGIHGLAV